MKDERQLCLFSEKPFLLYSRVVKFVRSVRLPESIVGQVSFEFPVVKVSFVSAEKPSTTDSISRVESKFKREFHSYIYSDHSETVAEVLLRVLGDRGLTVSTAESCTGGKVADMITAVAGSSKCYVGGVIAYSNKLKGRILAVPQVTLMKYGAVSRQTVKQMLDGIRTLTGSDCAIATSGIAGPSGGTGEKPVGRVYCGVYYPGNCVVRTHVFKGFGREDVKTISSVSAIKSLVDLLMGN